jgi:riboflavin kinase/FMN adenylyltransferase
MIIINGLEEIAYYHKSIENAAIAIGTFDGVHQGHQNVIQTMLSANKQTRIIITFINHPKEYTKSEAHPMRLMTLDEKIEVLSEFPVDYLVLLQFNKELMSWGYEKFIAYLTKHYKMESLHVGFNFRLGYQGLGDVTAIQKLTGPYGFELSVSEPVYVDSFLVSSTAIREALKLGHVEKANQLLGRKHYVTGKVITGKKLGRTIGFPTINLKISSNMTIIRSGVYVTETIRKGKIHPSVTNVGYNPTFNQNNFNLETFILDFDDNLYDEMIRVRFLHRIRDELQFDSLETLTEWIKKDVEITRRYFDTVGLQSTPSMI